MTNREIVTYTDASDGIEVNWVADPVFSFATEVDALNVLVDLGEQLQAARRQEAETMRYLKAAILAARDVREGPDGGRTTPTAIIGHSGLSRRTVYAILDEAGD